MKIDQYNQKYQQFIQAYSELGGDLTDDLLELKFERLLDFSIEGGVEGILQWYEDECNKCQMTVERIPLAECKQWTYDKKGSLVHSSGEFYRVDGIRVSKSTSREVSGGWDQPILTQVGYDGGILGLLRKRIDGIPHYLVEAKIEPGNYNLVQISTTVQATFSNLKRAHNGSSTPYSEYFLNTVENSGRVIFDRWMSEDGGRLLNKRNKSMIVEIPEGHQVELLEQRYRWVTLYQLVKLTREADAIVAPHIRGILSGV